VIASKEKGIETLNDGENYILALSSAQVDDAGVYNIVASNRVGKITSKTELIVQSNFSQYV
jgi:hypothetical protein